MDRSDIVTVFALVDMITMCIAYVYLFWRAALQIGRYDHREAVLIIALILALNGPINVEGLDSVLAFFGI